MNPPFPNSYWLEPGLVLGGEYPRNLEDDTSTQKLATILEAGARVFIDLTVQDELKPYATIATESAQRIGIDPADLEFHKFPIPDVSIPKSAETMPAILQTIRAARHRGKTVYLHCWGGKGRTGTVAGCLLADLFGFSGDAALTELTRRWQACAKSKISDSPQTHEQRQFVRNWPSPDRAAAIRSALLGGAVGDALGVPVEFQGRSQRQSDPVTGMREFGTHHQPAGTWSDDTSMILATIEGLNQTGGYDPTAIMREFGHWLANAKFTPHGKVFDIGNATSAAIRRFQDGTPPAECGGTGEHSNGNGSLMRILPIALAYADDPTLVTKAAEISALTHAHERSKFCCAFFCLVVSELLHGTNLPQATAIAWDTMDTVWKFSPAERPRFDNLHPDKLFTRQESQINSTGHVIDTLEAALWTNAQHDNYPDTVLHAVNLGDDTDTTACVAGALAGLIHGESGIPDEWLETLVQREALESAATALAKIPTEPQGTKE